MDQDIMLLAAVGACAIAAGVLAVAGAWLLALDQRLGLARSHMPVSLDELVEVLSLVGEDPARVQRVAGSFGGGVSAIVATGVRLARDGAEPLAFGRELLAAAARAGEPDSNRRFTKFFALGVVAAGLIVVAWAVPLLVDTDGWARLAVGLGYVGVLALFSSVALTTDRRVAGAEHESEARRLAMVAFLGLSVGESREQIRARLVEAASTNRAFVASRAA